MMLGERSQDEEDVCGVRCRQAKVRLSRTQFRAAQSLLCSGHRVLLMAPRLRTLPSASLLIEGVTASQ